MGLFLSGFGPTTYDLANPNKMDVLSKDSVKAAFKEMGLRTWSSAKSLGRIGGLFATFECTLEAYRGRHDIYNTAISGCSTGAVLGATSILFSF
jgi:mitochondrial import inner membrane translocase subunit TIM22